VVNGSGRSTANEESARLTLANWYSWTGVFTTVIQGLRPAKLHENESKPLHVFNGLAHVFDPGWKGVVRGVA
jgi:hypothetical protein